MNPHFIFVYGLLKSNYENEAAQTVRENCTLIGEGRMPGRLYDIGTYPGAVYIEDATTFVHGEIFEIQQNEEKLIHYLDHFEGVGADFPDPNEYRKKIISVQTEQGAIQASCYLYNWNLERLELIKTGKYEDQNGRRK
jgi:gamma-glutamylcyclotransferase (GGCT)/AIG2-like uncharacterized protein YtfP